MVEDANTWWMSACACLKPSVSLAQAGAELDALTSTEIIRTVGLNFACRIWLCCPCESFQPYTFSAAVGDVDDQGQGQRTRRFLKVC